MKHIPEEQRIQQMMARIGGFSKLGRGKRKQYTEAELRAKAELAIKLVDYKRKIQIRELFVDKAERALADEFLDKYLRDYSVATLSDINGLKQLIYLEVLHFRFQHQINDLYKNHKDLVPKELMDTIHKNLKEIVNFKEKLNILSTKEKSKDDYSELEKLFYRAKLWQSENQATRHCKCPYCSQEFLLKMRMTAWEAQKHPYLQDKLLCNQHLIELYLAGTVSLGDVAKILYTTEDYVLWLLERLRSNPKFRELFIKYGVSGVGDVGTEQMEETK